MAHLQNPDPASSPVLGILLLLAITLILAALVLLFCQMPQFYLEKSQPTPSIFKIISIDHKNEEGDLNYDSYMVVMNTAAYGFKSKTISAKTYRNGVLLNCAIPTLNGEDFAGKAHHYDVQYIRSAKGDTWYAGATIGIDYQDRTFFPGDIITFDVIETATGQVISSHSFKA